MAISNKYEETGRKLGAGQYGTAYLVKSKLNGELLVMKKFNTKLIDANEMKYALGEIMALKKLKHKNVIRYHDSLEDPSEFCIFMEYASGGTLGIELELQRKTGRPFGIDVVCKWGGQLLSAIDYIHEQKVMHRDIKPDNIFLSADKDVKIGDFGVVKMTDMEASLRGGTLMGTPAYMALEIFQAHSVGATYSARVDEWSAGIVIFELATLERPFTAKNINDLIKVLGARKFSTPLTRLTDKELFNVVDGLLRKHPATRLTARDALNLSPRMKQYDSGEIVDQAAAVPEQLPFNPVFKPVPAVIPPKIAMFDFTQKYQEMFDLSPTPASFGRAVVLRSKATGMAYVLKVLQSRAENGSQIKAELETLKGLKHPQLITYKMLFETPKGEFCVLLDFYSNRSLAVHIAKVKHEGGQIDEKSILDYCTQICLALKYLHDKLKTHRDVKSSNIFFRDRSRRLVKLGDSGVAKELMGAANLVNTFPDSASYLAPEVLAPGFKGPWPTKSDMFALGCVLYELATLKRPFDSRNLSTSGKGRNALENDLSKYSKDFVELVANLILSFSGQRKSAAEILEMPMCKNRISSFEK